MAISDREHLTPAHVPGFRDRLYKAYSHTGLPVWGRLNAIAKMAGLTPPGAKGLLDRDTPPKRKKNFNQLVINLVKDIEKNTNEVVNQDKLSSYLLSGEGDPFGKSPSEMGDLGLDFDDPVYIGQIYLLVNAIGEEIGVDIYNDIARDQLGALYRRIIPYCVKNNIKLEPQNQELRTRIISLIDFAKSNVL